MSVRLYGRVVGHGSHAQVTAGFAAALREAKLLDGLVALDRDLPPDAPQPAGAMAPAAIFTGPLGHLQTIRRGTSHRARFAMVAPNSSLVPLSLVKALEGLCTGLLVPSRWGAGVLAEQTKLPVLVVPHGVAATFFPSESLRAEARATYGLGAFNVLHLSTTERERKGTRPLIEAWAMLISQGSLPQEAKLRLVLDVEAASSTMAWMAERAGSGISNVAISVRMDLEPVKLARVYGEHHVVCQPSRGEGFGLCLKRGTLVTTPEGATPIESIAAGATVLTASGRWSIVNATAQRRGKHLLRVLAMGCPELLVTKEHLVLALDRGPKEKAHRLGSQSPRWIPAGSLTTDHYLVARAPLHSETELQPLSIEKYTANILIDGGRCVSKYASRVGAVTAAQIAAVADCSVRLARRALEPGETGTRINPTKRAAVRDIAQRLGYFDDRRPWLPRQVDWSVDLCRLIGYYAAEGSTGAKKKEGFAQFSLHATKDLLPVAQIDQALQSVFGLRAQRQRKGPHGLNLNVSSVPLARLLKELCGAKARDKRLPQEIWNLSMDCKTALLEALLRGDGSNGVNELRFTSTSPTLALQVRDLWLSLGVFARLRPRRLGRLYPGTLTPLRIHGKKQTTGKRLAWDVSVQGKWLPVALSMIGMELRRVAKTERTGCHAIPLAELPGAWLVRVSKIGRHRINGSVYDLQVAGESPSFVANGVVVHNCPLEALASGVPIAATRCTGHSEWFEDGLPGAIPVEHGPDAEIDDLPGALAPTVEPDAIAAALMQAYKSWPALDAAAWRGAEHIWTEWAWGKKLAPFIEYLKETTKTSCQ